MDKEKKPRTTPKGIVFPIDEAVLLLEKFYGKDFFKYSQNSPFYDESNPDQKGRAIEKLKQEMGVSEADTFAGIRAEIDKMPAQTQFDTQTGETLAFRPYIYLHSSKSGAKKFYAGQRKFWKD